MAINTIMMDFKVAEPVKLGAYKLVHKDVTLQPLNFSEPLAICVYYSQKQAKDLKLYQ
jgi:hypothetical protein